MMEQALTWHLIEYSTFLVGAFILMIISSIIYFFASTEDDFPVKLFTFVINIVCFIAIMYNISMIVKINKCPQYYYETYCNKKVN